MKRITIGRNPGCDIVFDQNMISRNHALLNVYPSGKYEIINMGTNGTKVNGTLISNGQPYPVKRGDSVVFAGQCHLDWKQVPNPRKPLVVTCIIVGIVLALALVGGGIYLAVNHDWSSNSGSDDDGGYYADDPIEQTDSLSTSNDSTTVVVDDVDVPEELRPAEKLRRELETEKADKNKKSKGKGKGGKKTDKGDSKKTDKDSESTKSDSKSTQNNSTTTTDDGEWSR